MQSCAKEREKERKNERTNERTKERDFLWGRQTDVQSLRQLYFVIRAVYKHLLWKYPDFCSVHEVLMEMTMTSPSSGLKRWLFKMFDVSENMSLPSSASPRRPGLLVTCLAYSLLLKAAVICPSEASSFVQTALFYNPKEYIFHG
jgi:hypothetical protein